MSLRRVLLVAVLTLSAAPAAPAAACGGDQYVETFTVHLGPAPATVPAGTTVPVPLVVTRAGAAPAPGVDILLVLRHTPESLNGASYAAATTDLGGRALLQPALPRHARQDLTVAVDAYLDHARLPCIGTVGEHGMVTAAWGKAVAGTR